MIPQQNLKKHLELVTSPCTQAYVCYLFKPDHFSLKHCKLFDVHDYTSNYLEETPQI